MKLKRAYSPGEVLNMKIPRYEFTGDWQASIGNPAKSTEIQEEHEREEYATFKFYKTVIRHRIWKI